MQRLVVKVGFPRVVKEFQDEVNALLEKGYLIKDLTVVKHGLWKVTCTAVCEKVAM